MANVTIDFSEKTGEIKPMHSVNNGPVYKFAADRRITNMPAYRAAGIPFARTHDASFFATCGGEHIVDVNFIFTDPDADDATHKRCRGGTKAPFFDLYEIAANHLKSCFPDLMIGGPAVAGVKDWALP